MDLHFTCLLADLNGVCHREAVNVLILIMSFYLSSVSLYLSSHSLFTSCFATLLLTFSKSPYQKINFIQDNRMYGLNWELYLYNKMTWVVILNVSSIYGMHKRLRQALLTFITMNHRCIHVFTTHICIPSRNFITEIYWLNVENRSKIMVI